MFQRTPSLTEQVKAHLKQRILAAEFEDGRIPAEMDLANELGVSRTTVRDALSRLEMEGVISRRQGAGTFVNQSGLLVKTRLETIVLYEKMIQEHGYTPTVELLGSEEQPADEKLARRLNLQPGDPILLAHKLYKADETPVIEQQMWIPLTQIKERYTQEDFCMPITQCLLKVCRQTLAFCVSEIVPLIATPQLHARLELPTEPTALLSFEEIIYNQEHESIAKTCSYFRDDVLRLRLVRRP